MSAGIAVTGGAGFIGSNFVRYWLRAVGEPVLVLDSLTYAGNLENLSELLEDPRLRFLRVDINDAGAVREALACAPPRAIVHFAAESHVDRSILDAAAFIRTNVQGTQTLLEVARSLSVARFLQVSTDEVYGSLGPTGRFTEDSPLAPNSPYAASKAAADLLCRAAYHTHGQDVVVTRCSNNYGPYQFPEKLIPLMAVKALSDQQLPVYGDGLNVRDWIHVEDHCRAVACVLERGRPGEVYNVGADQEWTNIDIVKGILGHLGKPESLIKFVGDRPGHDRRYAMDAAKLRTELGWTPAIPFEKGLADTLDWYLAHESWWRRVMTGEYQAYYDANYLPKRT